MTISASSLGGGGIFHAESFVYNQTIPIGQSGNLVTIGTAGKVTKLVWLVSTTTSPEFDMSVISDGNTVVSGTLADSNPNAGTFFVSSLYGNSNVLPSAGGLAEITGEFITIKKNTGSTVQPLGYSYVTGSVK